MNLLKKKVTKETLFSEYTKILNGVLGLSKRETEVFSFILLADKNGDKTNINSKSLRSEMIQTLKISEANLSRYLGTLKTKGLIIRGQAGWVINDLIRPVVKDNVFELRFILEIE